MLPEVVENNKKDLVDYNESINRKRKRINRIKIGLIVTLLILILIPIVLCIILGTRMSRLEKKLDDLSYYISMEGNAASTKNKNNYAFASDNESTINNSTENSSSNNNTNNNSNNASNNNVNTNNVSTNNGASNNDDTDNSKANKDNTNIIIENNSNDNIDIEYIDDEQKKDLIYYGKKVYLTFDDGPSSTTDEILDILAEYNVKGTFFVVGHTDEQSKERYRRIVDEGHTLGIHSYSHKYSEIYNSVEDFDKDFTKLWKLLYDTTGYNPILYRFPGGSLNNVNKNGMEDFIRYLNKKEITYYDWNVVNGDATGVDYTEEQMKENVLNDVKKKNTSIVLMHDSEGKDKTVATLPEILEALISGGAEVLALDETAPLIQQIKAKNVE